MDKQTWSWRIHYFPYDKSNWKCGAFLAQVPYFNGFHWVTLSNKSKCWHFPHTKLAMLTHTVQRVIWNAFMILLWCFFCLFFFYLFFERSLLTNISVLSFYLPLLDRKLWKYLLVFNKRNTLCLLCYRFTFMPPLYAVFLWFFSFIILFILFVLRSTYMPLCVCL